MSDYTEENVPSKIFKMSVDTVENVPSKVKGRGIRLRAYFPTRS